MQASGSSGVDGPCSSDAHQQVREAQAAFAAGVRGRRKAQALHLLRALQQQAQRQPRWVLQAAEELLSHHAGSLGLFGAPLVHPLLASLSPWRVSFFCVCVDVCVCTYVCMCVYAHMCACVCVCV